MKKFSTHLTQQEQSVIKWPEHLVTKLSLIVYIGLTKSYSPTVLKNRLFSSDYQDNAVLD